MTGTADGRFTGRPHARRQAALQAAHRHSRAVRALRVALPVLAVLIASGIVAATMFDPRVLLAQVDAAGMGISGSKIIMERPRLTGYGAGKDGQPKGYEVTAERAEQNMAKTNEVDLFALKARMALREDGWAELVATSGHMNTKTQVLDLFQSIRITTDLGDRADLVEARANFGAGEITTGKPVALSFERADLTANSMQLFSNGDRAVFTGKVVMVLKPDPTAPVVAPAPAGRP